MSLTFDERRAVVTAADQLRGLYEELCRHLNDPETYKAIWSLIREQNHNIESLVGADD